MPSDRDDIWMQRPAPAIAPDLSTFDGERYLIGIGGEIEAEHIHRYLFAATLCAGKDVLDIACGEGYGSAMLARVARSVLGVDIDEPTINQARQAYADSGAVFEPGSCDAIPAKKDSFDVVVSFETIEHIEDQPKLIREIRRVLRPGGLLVCSTPDTDVYRHPAGNNPFHLRELTREAFQQMLSKRFANVRVLGQRLVSGSMITRGEAAKTELLSTKDGTAFSKRPADQGAVYLIAVCSDERLPRLDTSVLSDGRYTIGRMSNLESSLRQLELQRREAAQRADASDKRLGEQTAAFEAQTKRAERAETLHQNAQDEIARLNEVKGRLVVERDAAANERDGAIRDAAGAHVELGRIEAELERVRAEMIEAREKAAAAQASAAASRAERETLRESTRIAIEERDLARDAKAAAEVEAAKMTERLRVVEQDRDRASQRHLEVQGEHRRELRQARAQTEDVRNMLGAVERERSRLANSRSWRWTAPARGAVSIVRRASGKAMGLAAVSLSTLGLPGSERIRTHQRAARFRRSSLFDPIWYQSAYPDVARSGVDPAWHFAARGSTERRNPGPAFDTAHYLETYPDVASSGVHAFDHYITAGINEGRSPLPPSVGRPEPAHPHRDRKETHTHEPASAPTDTAHKPHPSPHIEVRTVAPITMPVVSPARLAKTKALAFYLPQYHPIPENDAWWGKGFTEWSNVTRAHAMFPGHTQPILPGELGFYDLRLPEIRERQAELARSAGIHGFCYYHYWFNGRRVLERPLDDLVRSGTPDFPFCVCWANENWTRRWDGQEQEILLRQQHSLSSDRRFIIDLLPYLEDDRYIRVDGKPVLLVYRPDLMHDAADTAAVWRDECRRAGIGDLHLCAVRFRTGDPRPLGFDAAVEFPPHHFPAPEITKKITGLDQRFDGIVLDYDAAVRSLITSPIRTDYPLYHAVMPSWDNTARRMHNGQIYHGSSPALYEAWLRSAINASEHDGESLVFINAWNEWAEGAVLEPRRDIGDAYLRATSRVLGGTLQENTNDQIEQQSHSIAAIAAEPSPKEAQAKPAASTIEAKLKRAVRTNPALNSFVNRHPAIKNKAADLVRKLSPAHDQTAHISSNGIAAPARAHAPVRWRGRQRKLHPDAPKLLIVSHDAALAGAQLIVLENLRHWADAGFDCRVLLLGSGPLEPAFIEQCPTACIDELRDTPRPVAIDRLLDDLSKSGWAADAGFCNTLASSDAAARLQRAGIPVVSAVYELPTSIDDSLGGRAAIDRTLSSSRRVIVASEFVRDQLVRAYAIDPSRLEPVHTGVLARPHPDRERARDDIRRALGIDRRAPIVLGCGSIHHRKGTDLFVAAAAETKRLAALRQPAQRRDAVFVWVGIDQSGKTFGNWCRHDAARLGVADHIHFVGNHDDPGRWFAGADAFALTSREDPFPMVNLEAINAGLPVVAFEGAGGAPEVLTPHRLGEVVPYADIPTFAAAIDKLLHDSDANADQRRERAARFTRESLRWETYMAQLNARLASCSPRFESGHTAALAAGRTAP